MFWAVWKALTWTPISALVSTRIQPSPGNDEALPHGRASCFAGVPLRCYCTALIMSKIGRYIDTTMPPTTTPRNTIIIGSSRLKRLLTAASTSSS
jgi:hypothetical protein